MKTKLLCCLLISCMSFSLNHVLGQMSDHYGFKAVRLNPADSSTIAEDNVIWTEDVPSRTLTTATYYSNDGQIKIRNSSRPINFYNASKELVPIDPTLIPLNTNTWSAPNQPYPTYLHTDGSMEVSLNSDGKRMRFGKHCAMNNLELSGTLTVDGNSARVVYASSDLNKELFFRENWVKYNYVLESVPNETQSVYTFYEDVELPEGYTLVTNRDAGKETDLGWSGTLLVKDQSGNIVATFHEPVCYDASNQVIVASYRVEQKKGKFALQIRVPGSWLNAPERIFPVVIDPVITGPTTTWAGGQMPSCFIPIYNQDSILITIPANITVTQLNVTASFYADPWTGAWMQDGAMFFSTNCANSQTFTITGLPGQSAGTAYLDYYNLFNPLTCCFPESCNSQSFYLSYHLGRSLWGSGCNTTYIRYDPITTSWPFEAVVVGKTAETYGGQWSVPSAAICANDCELSGIAYAYYGVAPYTFIHPWSNDTIVQGTNSGCANGSTACNMTLINPNCPDLCDTVNTVLNVPPPTIIDACGNVVTGLPTEQVPLKPVPTLDPQYDTLVCSGQPFTIDLNSCIPAATLSWSEGWNTGNGNISDTLFNSSGTIAQYDYLASASLNGCFSDTVAVPLYVKSLPNAAYSTIPDPIVAGLVATFTDETSWNGGVGVTWFYTFGDGDASPESDPSHTYASPGDYEICLYVTDNYDCTDSLCELVPVVPAELVMPNIVTANNDFVNDWLAFKYLEFFPDNSLVVTNRWGNVIYEATGYKNDWSPVALTEGTYFYVLKINETDKEYVGFFQLVK